MKLKIKKNDLAINGASPVFDEVIHVGRPNIGDQEQFLKFAKEILDSHWLTNNGPMVQQLERRLEKYLDVKHCVAMCNGTIALEIAIRGLGLKGEVIIPSFTFIATAHALYWQGITPVFADIDPLTHNLDPDSVRNKITSKTTGIIGVHLWGRPANISELQKIADENNLTLMFDAAHAFSCTHEGNMIGRFGACEVFSFHATKIFNTFEGGAVITNDDELADKIRLMRNFGFSGLDNVVHPGTNGKMTEICAAMGLANLNSLDSTIIENKNNYLEYQDAFSDVQGITMLEYDETETNNYHYIVIEIGDDFPVPRNEIIETLHKENIRARKYFWPGCHKMKPYSQIYPQAKTGLSNTIKVAERVIVLPTGIALDSDMIKAIVSIFKALSGIHE